MTTQRRWLVRMAFRLLEAATAFRQRARCFYHEVSLLGYFCPTCSGPLRMTRDGEAACSKCGTQIDPTQAFQCCVQCGGRLKRKLTRYACTRCGALADSRFAFGPVRLDRAYFRRMVRRSRQRQRRRRAALIAMLCETRSNRHIPAELPRLEDMPGLDSDLDAMAGIAIPALWRGQGAARLNFDLARYRNHILNTIRKTEILFERIPPLIDDKRLDRIFRFIAAVYLQHDGQVALVQYPEALVVEAHEPHSKG